MISSPTSGGNRRGVHNCGRCDKDILRAINKYSLGAGREVLEDILKDPCECRRIWLDQLEYDKKTGLATDIERWKDTTWKK